MSTDVVMPQMGESIAEGTIVRWIKKVGDTVDRDEPLFEISTDKVDAEIPVAGRRRPHRDPRQGRRDGSGQQRRGGDRRRPDRSAGRNASRGRRSRSAAGPSRRRDADGRQPRAGAAGGRQPHRTDAAGARPSGPRRTTRTSAIRQRSSPLVRKIAKEHNVDISQTPRHRHRRPRDEGRHPRRSSERAAAGQARRGSARRQAATARRAIGSAAVRAGRVRPTSSRCR